MTSDTALRLCTQAVVREQQTAHDRDEMMRQLGEVADRLRRVAERLNRAREASIAEDFDIAEELVETARKLATSPSTARVLGPFTVEGWEGGGTCGDGIYLKEAHTHIKTGDRVVVIHEVPK